MSALLFIIVVKNLAAKIKQSSTINGIQVTSHDKDNSQSNDIRIVQFADDTTILTNSVKSVIEIMTEVELFGENAGPRINWSKSKYENKILMTEL